MERTLILSEIRTFCLCTSLSLPENSINGKSVGYNGSIVTFIDIDCDK